MSENQSADQTEEGIILTCEVSRNPCESPCVCHCDTCRAVRAISSLQLKVSDLDKALEIVKGLNDRYERQVRDMQIAAALELGKVWIDGAWVVEPAHPLPERS